HHHPPGRVLRRLSGPRAADRGGQHALLPVGRFFAHDQRGGALRQSTRSPGMQLSERLSTPISTAELERRWAAVRAVMEAEKIDVLLMQNNNDHMGGYVKYFTDLSATNGYPMTVVFPRDDDMTIVNQGAFAMVKELPHEGDG